MKPLDPSRPGVSAACSLAWWLLGAASPALAAAGFETPPERPAAQVLPADLASGPNHRVADPVRNDGTMNLYALESRFGSYEVYGLAMLEIRIREMAALAELERVSKSEVFLDAVGRSVTSQVETVAEVVSNPVGTVKGIPRGASNLFKTYKLKARDAKEAVQEKQDEKGENAEAGEDDSTRDAAKAYSLKYLGVTGAQRRWYAELGVDPYTTNEALRQAVKSVARVDAATSFGLRFAGIPSIPGIGMARTAMDAIWREDPVLIRERNRKFLASLGLVEEEIGSFEDNLWLSPTRQVFLLEAVRALDGVAGRAELARRGLTVESEEEALTFLQSTGVLVWLHRKTPLVEVLGGVRLPAGRTADGRLVVCAGLESVFWTERVAEGARGVTDTYRPEQASQRQIWLAGSASPRLRAELERLGWQLFDRLDLKAEGEGGS